MSATPTGPILISYAHTDIGFVKHLKNDLQDQGFRTWIDWEDIEPGAPDWEEVLRKAIRDSYAVLLIASPDAGASCYVNDELRVADLYQRPVYPIWISGSQWLDATPLGWENKQYIDARDNNYKKALTAIGAALNSPASVRPEYTELPEPRNPYKGLQAFKSDDARDFFGRERFISELTTALDDALTLPQQSVSPARLLAIVGPSGSGKSSTLLAGLLPALRAGRLPNSSNWIYLNPFVPGFHPLETLARALASHLPATPPEVILAELSKDAQSLHRYASALASTPETCVVLALDQFEALFAPTLTEEERSQFIELLVPAATDPAGSLIVLLTLRADFYDRPLKYPALASLIQHHHHLLLPLPLSDLRAVITRPAALPDVQVAFEGDLVGDILFDLQGQPGALPLLQFTLDRMFRHRQGQLLTLETYRAIGGARKALALHAEETYNHLPSDEHRRFARVLFLRLIDATGTEQEAVRRRAPVSEFLLNDEQQTRVLQETMDAFVAARLITIDQGTETTFVEMSHEALIGEWQQLLMWLHEAPEENRLLQELSRDVAAWKREKHVRDRLYRGTQLKAAQVWARRNVPSQVEHAFLLASQRRQTHARVRILAIFVLVLLLAVPTTLFILPLLRASVTTLTDDGQGSLRQAVLAAKPGDTITFDSSLKGTIFLNDVLIINKNLTIRGPGADTLSIVGGLHTTPIPTSSQGPTIIKFSPNDYTIDVLPNFSVSISGLSFKNSKHTSNGFILNKGNLTLSNCVVADNSVTGADASNSGIVNTGGTLKLINSTISGNTVSSTTTAAAGAIRNDFNSTLILINSSVSNNTVSGQTSGGAGITNGGMLLLTNSIVSNNMVIGSNVAIGGGIWNLRGTVSLNTSTISGNKVICSHEATCKQYNSGGGGLYNSEGKTQLNNSRVSDNRVIGGDGGGGIYNTLQSTLTLIKSIISNNSVSAKDGGTDQGGGIVNIRTSNMTIIDSLISGNQASGSSGGGGISNGDNSVLLLTRSTVANNGADFGGGITSGAQSTLSLVNSTISDNSAFLYGGAMAVDTGSITITFCTIYNNTATLATGGLLVVSGKVEIRNSIIAGNNSRAPGILGTVITYGYNLLVESSDVNFIDPLNLHHTDIPAQTFTDLGIDPKLHNNGGVTPTHALLPDSPAINHIPLDACRIDNISTDQRGVKRPLGALCDIGAYEYAPS